MNISIRTARISDIPVIQSITYLVWPSAYRDILSQEQINYMLELMYSTASLEKQMTALNIEFILLVADDLPSGFASFSFQEENIHRLHKLYLLESHQGKGLGKALLSEVEQRALAQGAQELELNVNKYNNAKDFYYANGFKLHREEVLDIGYGFYMDDFVFRKKLNKTLPFNA